MTLDQRNNSFVIPNYFKLTSKVKLMKTQIIFLIAASCMKLLWMSIKGIKVIP